MPEFRYHSTGRNPYQGRLLALPPGFAYSDEQTEAHQGRWRELIAARPERLHVEIGTNAGHVLVEWAAKNPGEGWIGIDWKFKAIFRAAEKIQRRGLKNALFLRAHAGRLGHIFAPGEVDALYLFFPDPWPKRAHAHNRFISPERLREIHKIMKSGGEFHIRTDHPGYFEWMEQAAAKVADLWEVRDRTRDRHAGHPDPTSLQIPDVTLFERLFIKDGIKINAMRLVAK